MKTYFLIGASDWGIEEPQDQYEELEVVIHPDPILRKRDRPALRPAVFIEKITFRNKTRFSLKTNLLNFRNKFLQKLNTTSSQNSTSNSFRLPRTYHAASPLQQGTVSRSITGDENRIVEEADNAFDEACSTPERKASTDSTADSGCAIDKEDFSTLETAASTFFDKHFDEEDPPPDLRKCACRLM